jgi:hypothetical protein
LWFEGEDSDDVVGEMKNLSEWKMVDAFRLCSQILSQF